MRVIVFTLFLLAGCATFSDTIPELPNRTLRFSLDRPSLEYQYEQCITTFWGICTKHGIHIDYYDLTDLMMRKQLIDMGFVAKVKEKPIP